MIDHVCYMGAWRTAELDGRTEPLLLGDTTDLPEPFAHYPWEGTTHATPGEPWSK